jgi:hypothetical protein
VQEVVADPAQERAVAREAEALGLPAQLGLVRPEPATRKRTRPEPRMTCGIVPSRTRWTTTPAIVCSAAMSPAPRVST